MSVWFTSDFHLGHRLVSGIRGFSEVTDHDSAIEENWRRRVHPKDHVWVLGDLIVSQGQLEHALNVIHRLPGVKHFIAGNHDPCHPMHRDAHRWQRRYLEAFDSVQPFARRRVGGVNVLLSHFPYRSDHTGEARYMQYRLRDEGEWLLHGHTHSALKRTSTREIHVGLDAWDLEPVNLAEIEKIMREYGAFGQ